MKTVGVVHGGITSTRARNDGFRLDQARLGFTGSYKERLSWTMIMDGVSTSDPNANDPIAHVRTALRDAFLHWHATEFFNVWLGQTFMPGDYEGMISRRELNFSARSVASQGVGAGLGYQVAGLSAGRQTGVVLGARDLVAGILHLDYRMALANGNGINVTGNDNEQPAFKSGSKTFLLGLINFAVSAIKCTPAITIISAEVFEASTARARESAEKSAIP